MKGCVCSSGSRRLDLEFAFVGREWVEVKLRGEVGSLRRYATRRSDPYILVRRVQYRDSERLDERRIAAAYPRYSRRSLLHQS